MAFVGLLVTVYSLLGSFSGLGAGVLCDKIGRRTVLLLSLSSVSFLFFLLGSTTKLWYVVILLILLVMLPSASHPWNPATTTMLADVIKPHARTRGYGLLRVGGNMGFAIGPAAGGLLASSLGFQGLTQIYCLLQRTITSSFVM